MKIPYNVIEVVFVVIIIQLGVLRIISFALLRHLLLLVTLQMLVIDYRT